MKREVLDYFQDILDSIEKCEIFLGELSFEEFSRDDKTIYAVIRSLEIIGEAVKNIPDDVKVKYDNIPWKNIAGMRDKLIHGYFGADIFRVWKTAKEEVPLLKPIFTKIISEFEN